MHPLNLKNIFALTPPIIVELVVMRSSSDPRAWKSREWRQIQPVYHQTERINGEDYSYGYGQAGSSIVLNGGRQDRDLEKIHDDFKCERVRASFRSSLTITFLKNLGINSGMKPRAYRVCLDRGLRTYGFKGDA